MYDVSFANKPVLKFAMISNIYLVGGFNCLQLYPSLFRRGRGHNSTLYVKTASLAAVHSRCFRGHGYWEESDRQGMDKDATIGMGRNGGIFEDARVWHIAMWEFSVVCLTKDVLLREHPLSIYHVMFERWGSIMFLASLCSLHQEVLPSQLVEKMMPC